MIDAVIIAVAGALAWLLSTVAAGGGGLLMVPVVSLLLGAGLVAPVVTVGGLVAEPWRIGLFWKDVD